MPSISDTSPSVRRIGFVGTGGVALRHATVLSQFEDVRLVAATDIDPDRAAGFAEDHGMVTVTDVDQLLALELDAVYVCVPPFAHGSPELALLDAGVALFVEKPLAADEKVATVVADRVSQSAALCRVGHHWRCAEPVARARELLQDRSVRLVTGWWLDKVPPVPWWTDRSLSGGPMIEQAVHVLDLARFLVGEVEQVCAFAAGALGAGGVETATASVLGFRSGAVGTMATSCVLRGKHRAGLEIVADGLVVGVGEDWLEVSDGSGAPERTTFDPWTARVAADRRFVDALQGRSGDPATAPPDYADAMQTHQLACALVRSVETGCAERLR
jgi:myo-inositol 2-dehydrogenase / D-chiro-inositol 1-dehydrogenase